MIPPLRCTVLLVALSAALPSTGSIAQTLYKWVEADGSITFSADPPESGIDYETVTSMNDDVQKGKSVPATQPAAKLTEKPVQADISETTQRETSNSTQAGAAANAPAEPSRSRVAPMRDQKMGITAADNSSSELSDAPTTGAAVPAQQAPVVPTVSIKQRQCEDLKKRVISLERRLKSRLTPEDMDNTVVHMARYQRSYDQYCVQ